MKTRMGWLSVAVALLLAGPALADPKWSAFGNAGVVKLGPGDFAVGLASDVSSDDFDDWYGGIAYSPKPNLTFAGIHTLSTDVVSVAGCFGGGSPRFQIHIGDEDGNFVGNVFVYIGTPPNFNDCPDEWTSTGNVIGSTDLRFDTSQVGGTFYDDYEGALELVGDLPVLGIQLVVDGGWGPWADDGLQAVLIDNFTVNKDTLRGSGFKK